MRINSTNSIRAYWFAAGRNQVCRRVVLSFVATLASTALAHPELAMQIEALDARLAVEPGNAELFARRGELHRRHRDYPAAASDFNAARNADSDYPLVDFHEGRLLLDAGDAAGSERLLSRYLIAHPRHGMAWILRGKADMRLMQPERAAVHFDRAIQVSTSPSPELYRLQILSLAAIGEPGVGSALRIVDAGLQRFPVEMSLLGLGADIAIASNQQAKAEYYLNRLPDSLHKLPQWATRIEAFNCLAASEPAVQESCIQQAKDGIADQIKELNGFRTEP